MEKGKRFAGFLSHAREKQRNSIRRKIWGNGILDLIENVACNRGSGGAMTGKDSELDREKNCFIVLHYMAVEVTLECVQTYPEKYGTRTVTRLLSWIIISPDESYRILNENIWMHVPVLHYFTMKKIWRIFQRNNVRGSDMRFAITAFDFMVVLNNDAFYWRQPLRI